MKNFKFRIYKIILKFLYIYFEHFGPSFGSSAYQLVYNEVTFFFYKFKKQV